MRLPSVVISTKVSPAVMNGRPLVDVTCRRGDARGVVQARETSPWSSARAAHARAEAQRLNDEAAKALSTAGKQVEAARRSRAAAQRLRDELTRRVLHERYRETGNQTRRKYVATTVRCAATKLDGVRCRNRVTSDGDTCWVHSAIDPTNSAESLAPATPSSTSSDEFAAAPRPNRRSALA
jgi:hypothetical protein